MQYLFSLRLCTHQQFLSCIGLLLFGACCLTDAAAQQEQAAKVYVSKAVVLSTAAISWFAGTVIGRNDSRLAAEVEGRLITVLEVGDRVREGAVVAEIEGTSLQLMLDEAEADLIPIQVKIDFYRRESRRLESLAKNNNAAKNRLDEVKSSYEEYKGRMQATRLRLARARDRLQRTLIRAPFNGVVSERYKSKGERVDSGDEVLRLVDTDSLEISVRVTQDFAAFIAPDASLLASDGKHDARATVRALVPVGDDISRLYELRLQFQNTPWLAGQALRVAIPQSGRKEIVAVPRDALVIRQDGTTIFRINQNDVAEIVPVQVGIAQGQFVEVTGKLRAGDNIVVQGNERLRPGQAVQIMASPPPP